MNNAASFLRGQPDDSGDRIWQILSSYKEQLWDMRVTFLYEINLQDITTDNLNYFDGELRGIIRGVDNLRRSEDLSHFISSVDEFIATVQNIQLNLHTASYISSKRATTNETKRYFQLLQECPNLLDRAIDCFKLE
jgi:DNA-binding FrmR family transcriptional regulator